MKRSFNEEREEGFSLVELLVVIVIIGILSSIAIAAFMNQRKKAAEASLKADLKTVSTHVATELMDKDAAKMREMFNDNHSVIVTNNGGENLLSKREWNSTPELKPIYVSKGNTIEIVVIAQPAGTWTKPFEPGDYCLSATNPNTAYNYVPGAGSPADYNKMLYFDTKAGGVKTIDELLDMTEAGQDISCEGYVGRYKAAKG